MSPSWVAVMIRLKRRGSDLASSMHLGPVSDVGQTGRVVEVQVEELPQDDLAEPAVLLQDELVVQARGENDVLDPLGHEIVELAEPAATQTVEVSRALVGRGLDDWARWSGDMPRWS